MPSAALVLDIPVLLAGFAGVVALNLYALVLVLVRAPVYGERVYRPMIVNIGLSALALASTAVVWVAPLIGRLLAGAVSALVAAALSFPPGFDALPWIGVVEVAAFLIGYVVWILLLPNSMYLITELNMSHRREGTPVPLWYDIVQTLTLALSGVANAVFSLLVLQLLLVMWLGDGLVPTWSYALSLVVILLASFGIYLGRYIRVNSWDVKHPIAFARKLVRHFRVPVQAGAAAGFVLTHGILLAIIYLPVALVFFAGSIDG